MRFALGSLPGKVAYISATSSSSIVAPIASILLRNSFLARIASGDSEYLVMPPCPASPNFEKVLILSVMLFKSQLYMWILFRPS